MGLLKMGGIDMKDLAYNGWEIHYGINHTDLSEVFQLNSTGIQLVKLGSIS